MVWNECVTAGKNPSIITGSITDRWEMFMRKQCWQKAFGKFLQPSSVLAHVTRTVPAVYFYAFLRTLASKWWKLLSLIGADFREDGVFRKQSDLSRNLTHILIWDKQWRQWTGLLEAARTHTVQTTRNFDWTLVVPNLVGCHSWEMPSHLTAEPRPWPALCPYVIRSWKRKWSEVPIGHLGVFGGEN